jgi:hypothetical protein
VESLDRVSRQNPWDAFPVLQQIINGGVTIVTLFDGKTYDVAGMRENPMRILESLFVMIRANEESETKSRRLKAVWTAKRRRANDRPMTSRLPSWLAMDSSLANEGGKIVLIPERAEVVQRIIRDFLAGVGQHRIAEALNREGVPVFGGGTMWHRSYVAKLLTSPALTGTFVPREIVYEGGRKTRRELEAVHGYFPPVISQEQWDDLVALMSSGNRQPKQDAKGLQNILAGLAECPLCGFAMTRVMKGQGPKGGKPKLVCTRAKAGAGCEYHALDLPEIERAIREGLDRVLEEAPSGNAAADAEVEALRQELERTDAGISALIDELRERGRSPALSVALAEEEKRKAEAEERLRAALILQEAVSPISVERRRAELSAALSEPVGVLNARLRGVFAAVLPDHRDGGVYFRFHSGVLSAVSLVFGWPAEG